MKIRVVSSLLALPLLFGVLYFLPKWCIPAAIAVLCVVCAFEILYATRFASDNPAALFLSFLAAAIIPLATYFHTLFVSTASLLVFVCGLFIVGFLDPDYMTFERICGCAFAAVVIPLFLTGVVRISMMENGVYFVIFPFVIAWGCDTTAYFVGRALGRHKLCPAISPKKTVEGAVGGMLGGALALLLTGYIVGAVSGKTPMYAVLAAMGALCAVMAQIGDLSMSLIKRNYKIKDYGSVMPGHGGVLDRFDSVIFAAPAVEALLILVPGLFL